MLISQEEIKQIQIIKRISSPEMGELEIIDTNTGLFLAKQLNSNLYWQFQTSQKKYEKLMDEIQNLQNYRGRVNLNGKDYLLFDYYDYTVRDMMKNNERNYFYLPEQSIKIFFLQIHLFLNKMKKFNINYSQLNDKVIYIDQQGAIKMAHPFLYNSFFKEENQFSHSNTIAINKSIGRLGEIMLQMTSLCQIRDEKNQVDLDLIEKAFKIVKRQYSFQILFLLRQFSYGIIPEYKNANVTDTTLYKLNRLIDMKGELNLPLVTEENLDNLEESKFHSKMYQTYQVFDKAKKHYDGKVYQSNIHLKNSYFDIPQQYLPKNSQVLETNQKQRNMNNSMLKSLNPLNVVITTEKKDQKFFQDAFFQPIREEEVINQQNSNFFDQSLVSQNSYQYDPDQINDYMKYSLVTSVKQNLEENKKVKKSTIKDMVLSSQDFPDEKFTQSIEIQKRLNYNQFFSSLNY